jgi:purine nucleosidase
MRRRKILIDTDTGIDDALAILVALADPAVEVVGLGATYGNCRTVQAAQNARCVLEAAGALTVPVALGVPDPPAARALIDYAAPVHGRDGLGDAGFSPRQPMLSSEDAVTQLLRVAREVGRETALLALGPLTNLAAALRRDPAVLARFAAVVIMGGMGPEWLADSVVAADPRFLAVEDPNVRHNPEAADAVAHAPGAISWVGMNVTGQVLLPMRLLDDLAGRGTPQAAFAQATHRHYSAFVTRATGSAEPVFTVHDTIAAAVLLDGRIATGSVAATPVVQRDAAGRSSLWGRAAAGSAPTHRFVTTVDRGAVEQRIRRALS